MCSSPGNALHALTNNAHPVAQVLEASTLHVEEHAHSTYSFRLLIQSEVVTGSTQGSHTQEYDNMNNRLLLIGSVSTVMNYLGGILHSQIVI